MRQYSSAALLLISNCIVLHVYLGCDESLTVWACACSAPYVEMDMRSGELDGYDAVFLSPHKFVGGPGTPGILLMSKALYRLSGAPPSTCGGGTVAYVNSFSEAVSHSSIFPVPARRA
jgi:selenocysteine lyase/cysteine desulfurase